MADTRKTILLSWNNVGVIFHREFRNYFNTAIGYVSIFIFVLILNFLVFNLSRFWEVGKTTMDSFFRMLQVMYIFFVPAITMRLWAEEKRSGTIELLFTLPIRNTETIIGKYLSAIVFLMIGLASTLFFALTLGVLSNPDWWLVAGGYIGALLSGASYIAMGLYISWLTQDQIIAFLSTLSACFILFMMGYPPLLQVLGPLSPVFAFLSVSWHFDSLGRGLLDSRNIFYFISFIGLFLYLNKRSIENRR